MTCLAMVRELQALERTAAVIAQNGVDADWGYVVHVLGARAYFLRACLSAEDPALVRAALAELNAERQTVNPKTECTRLFEYEPLHTRNVIH